MRLLGLWILGLGLGLTLSACSYFEPEPKSVAKNEPAAPPAQSSGRDEANWARMEAFLAESKKKPGTIVQPSGTQWRVIKKGPGQGGKPTSEATVTVRYRGTLIDGTLFDETPPGAPAAIFTLKTLIKAWKEVIPLMQRGDKVEIVAPSDQAYGPEGREGIKPDQVLVFEMELLDFL
jgi:FKBP-type peptidyl-prolyl cis-trans isomerase